VGTLLKTVVALLVILAVAIILITPDRSDDAVGIVLHHHHALALPAVLHGLVQNLIVLTLSPVTRDLSLQRLESLELLDLVCVRLC
jgi:hypothetical protein